MLKRNIRLNSIKNIDVVHGAISTHTGKREMFMSTHSNLHTFHSEGSAANYLNPTPVNVSTFTLTYVINNKTRPDLLRMDVEGHEVEIFDTTYHAIDDKIDSDGSKMDKLHVVPYDMKKRDIRLKDSNWKDDVKVQIEKLFHENEALEKIKLATDTPVLLFAESKRINTSKDFYISVLVSYY